MEIAEGPDVNVSLPLGVDTYVSEWALWSLASAGRKDEEIMNLCEKAVQDKTRPPHLRASLPQRDWGSLGTKRACAAAFAGCFD